MTVEQIGIDMKLPSNYLRRVMELIKAGYSNVEIERMGIKCGNYLYNKLFYVWIYANKPIKGYNNVPKKEAYWRSEQEMEIQAYNFEGLSESEQLIYNEL